MTAGGCILWEQVAAMSGGLLKYEGAADGKKYADRWRMARAHGSVRTKEMIAEIDEKIKRQREAGRVEQNKSDVVVEVRARMSPDIERSSAF
jgi:hypothetical protein